MKDLIEALNIFLKYIPAHANVYAPTHCEHDVLMVFAGITEEMVSEEDKKRLDKLGFDWNDEYDCWSSFRFGSC